MQDYTVHRCTKRCRKSNRALAPGEWYYSVVERKSVNFVRYDIAISQWSGPPTHALAWWKSQMPQARQAVYTPTPNSLLLERLRELCDDPSQQTLAYLLAMLLVRRRVLEYASETVGSSDDPASEDSLVLKTVADGTVFYVSEPTQLNEQEILDYQNVLQEQLVLDAGDLAEEAQSEVIEDESIATQTIDSTEEDQY